jgi:Xaa-Pro aminopeptidase
VDGAPVIRRLLSIHTPEEIERTRRACQAGVWIHNQTPAILQPGLTEREVLRRLSAAFAEHFGAGYTYQPIGAWEVRNPDGLDSNFFHAVATDRVYRAGDLICRGNSGVSYRGYPGDVDRVWYIGQPPLAVRDLYRATWECNQAMAEQIRPGNRCSDIFAACVRVEARHGLPQRLVGRVGHGIRNTGGLSVHPDCHTVLEPGMIISVEPMIGNEYGFFDLEDQYLVTATGRAILHDPAPETLPLIAG